MRDLDARQTRQLIDCEQVFVTLRSAQAELRSRYGGAMSWKTIKGRRYLYRKVGAAWKAIGPHSEATDQIHDRFHAGRAALRQRTASLDATIRAMAPVNRAMRLGRVPFTAARILRRLDRIGLLRRGLTVAGTHALYAYERLGGVHFGETAMATRDLDLLYDARVSLKIVSADFASEGLLGMLQSLDTTFRPTEAGSFRAVDAKGFMVDLITPTSRSPVSRRSDPRMSDRADDLAAVEIAGLAWLENSPTITQIAIDERGYPLTIVAPDPRAFACHKAWIARRDDREPLKRRRDLAQARALIAMLATRVPAMPFDDPALSAIPRPLIEAAQAMVRDVANQAPDATEDWDG